MTKPKKTRRPPPYELFFAPLAVIFDPNTVEYISFAYFASKYGHAKQFRDDGSRYFDHPKAAAWIYIDELAGRDPRVIIDILLHDIQEDAYLLSTYRINRNFGEEIALDVRSLTKLPKNKEATEQYIQRIVDRGPWAITAKLCDRLHNLRTIMACAPEKIARQLSETKEILLPMLSPALRSYGGKWAEYADKLESKIKKVLDAFEA